MSNAVVVLKVGAKLRMFIDFKDLNKAYPKDYFPLPSINRRVDSTSEHELLSFIDAYSGYHQVLIQPEDAEKTSFIMENGLYCYMVMPFDLINVEAIYQCMVTKMFHK